MTGLDTNVLVRLLTHDDAQQLASAKRYIAANFSSESPAFINRIVIVEVVWVLETAYTEYSHAHRSPMPLREFSIQPNSTLKTGVRSDRRLRSTVQAWTSPTP